MGAKPGRNRRGAKKAGASRGRKGGGTSRGAQRLGLIVFAVVFVVLFVVVAVAQGVGTPSVPSGDVALVSGVPSELGHISEADYHKSLAQQEAQSGLKKAPKAGSKKAEELREAAIGELLTAAWIFGAGEELGIEVTEKEVEAELAKVKKESFQNSAKAFRKFMKESHFTQEDVNKRVELQILSTKIREKVTKEAPPVTESDVEDYYEAEKATQYTKKPSRDVRVIVNEDKKKVDAAKKMLEADNSEAGWKKATKKYSPTTASQAGLQKEISEEFLVEPLKKDIFGASVGQLIGPVKQEKSYLLLEVVKLHAEKTQPLDEVKATIEATLKGEREQKYFAEWVAGFESKWTSRSHCAAGFVITKCANYEGSGHPTTAPEACYEANPKTPTSECPAPVTQNQPALPGSVTIAKPEGERMVQRPRPPTPSTTGEGSATAPGGSSPEAEAAAKAAEEAAAKAAAEGQ